MRINGYSWLLGFTRFTPVLCEAASSTGGPQNTSRKSKKSRKFSNRKLRKCQTFTRQKANTGRLVYGLHVFHTFLTFRQKFQTASRNFSAYFSCWQRLSTHEHRQTAFSAAASRRGKHREHKWARGDGKDFKNGSRSFVQEEKRSKEAIMIVQQETRA